MPSTGQGSGLEPEAAGRRVRLACAFEILVGDAAFAVGAPGDGHLAIAHGQVGMMIGSLGIECQPGDERDCVGKGLEGVHPHKAVTFHAPSGSLREPRFHFRRRELHVSLMISATGLAGSRNPVSARRAVPKSHMKVMKDMKGMKESRTPERLKFLLMDPYVDVEKSAKCPAIVAFLIKVPDLFSSCTMSRCRSSPARWLNPLLATPSMFIGHSGLRVSSGSDYRGRIIGGTEKR
jgi:hypothetical protein